VRPGDGALAPYYRRYVDAVEGPLDGALDARPLVGLLRRLPADATASRYAPGKWTVAEVAGHVIDTERIFGGRALRLARGDGAPLPGYDQDAFVATLPPRPLAALADELDRLRASTLDLFRSLPDDALDRVGTVSGGPMSARAAFWVVAGHERHHVRVLEEWYDLGGQ
jgi:uncharacterized damage-inducible protein DinB